MANTFGLEPLDHRHVDGLGGGVGGRIRISIAGVPFRRAWPRPKKYVDTALAWRDAGTAVPFAIVRMSDGIVIGSTRFWNMERWAWPAGHPSHGRSVPDACEIGYTWLARSAIRTGANTEAKLLMLTPRFRSVAGAARLLSHRCAERTFARGAGTHRRAVRRDSCARTAWPRTSSRGTRSATRFVAGGVASRETERLQRVRFSEAVSMQPRSCEAIRYHDSIFVARSRRLLPTRHAISGWLAIGSRARIRRDL